MIGRIIGACLSWALAGLCGYGVYSLAAMIYNGVMGQNWLMAIAGGVLAYFFGALLVIGAILFIVLGLIVLAD